MLFSLAYHLKENGVVTVITPTTCGVEHDVMVYANGVFDRTMGETRHFLEDLEDDFHGYISVRRSFLPGCVEIDCEDQCRMVGELVAQKIVDTGMSPFNTIVVLHSMEYDASDLFGFTETCYSGYYRLFEIVRDRTTFSEHVSTELCAIDVTIK